MNKAVMSSLALFTTLTFIAQAGVLYTDPAGGWGYSYDGSSAAFGGSVTGNSLDGSWYRGLGSDSWDGSAIGTVTNPGDNPGGVMVIGGSYLRIQDPGDPRNATAVPPIGDPSNRKIYFNRDLTGAGATLTALNDGVTLSFRARVPLDGPLDGLYTRDNSTPASYPAQGDGQILSNNGKGNIGIIQGGAGGAIAFSLSTAFDGVSGLVMNNLNGTVATGDIDTGEAGILNLLSLDPTAWHEFWVTIVSGGSGTHKVNIYVDGSITPTVFDVTAGTAGSELPNVTQLLMGEPATGSPGASGSGALDLDFVSFKPGVFAPVVVPEPATWSLVALGASALLLFRRFRKV